MEGYFLSQRNYTLLYEIVKTGLYKRWNYDISTDRENKFLEKMRTVMKQIYNDRSRFNIDETKPTAVVVKELNKYTLDFIIPHFGEIIQYNISVRGKREEVPPQAVLQLAPQTPSNLQRDFSSGLQSTHARMSERSTSSRTGSNENVMSNYQRLNSERDSILKPHVPKPIDFTLPTGDKSDPSDRYMKMQTQRDNEIDRFKHIRETNTGDVVPAVPAPRNDTITLTNSGIEGYSNMNTANIAADNFNNMVEEKKRIDRSIESSLEELTAQREKLFQQTTKLDSSPFGKKDAVVLPSMVESNTEGFLGEKNMLDNRNDGVFFKDTDANVNPTDLFKEDVTIKAQLETRLNRTELPRGVAFKPPVETEYRTHYITIDSRDRIHSTSNSPVNYVVQFPYMKLKNIKSIKMLSAILPNEEDIRNEPYLLISIPEIEGPLFNTNNKNMKIFTKIFNNKNTHNTSMKYLNYMPEPIKKEYPINALGSIQQLSIKILKYDGSDVGINTPDDEDITSFTFEIVQTVADTSNLQSNMI